MHTFEGRGSLDSGATPPTTVVCVVRKKKGMKGVPPQTTTEEAFDCCALSAKPRLRYSLAGHILVQFQFFFLLFLLFFSLLIFVVLFSGGVRSRKPAGKKPASFDRKKPLARSPTDIWCYYNHLTRKLS